MKYKPNWVSMVSLLLLIAIQSVHYGYILGTWNRINHIMVAKYGWTKDQLVFYEAFIGNTPVMGMIIGRFIGSPLVNKGRFLCIIISSVAMILGDCAMLFLNIYSFLAGRLICGIGAGLFFASAPRYIEECSPPHLFSLLYTLFALGIALNRPIVMFAATMIPEKVSHPTFEYVDFLKLDKTWRYFIGLPIVFCIIFIAGMFLLVKCDTPMYLISQ